MRSHRDGASGLLQIGLSLQGRRYLSFGLHRSPEPAAGPDPSVWDEEAWQRLPAADLTTLALNPGDVYVATPAVFEHGVAYEPMEDPTVALMFRLALPDTAATKDLNRCETFSFDEAASAVSTALAEALSRDILRLPSLADVREVETMLCEKAV
ncbi:ankrd29, partial [Symbiodinium sp. CCMP2456]